jgi:hypothetical protein
MTGNETGTGRLLQTPKRTVKLESLHSWILNRRVEGTLHSPDAELAVLHRPLVAQAALDPLVAHDLDVVGTQQCSLLSRQTTQKRYLGQQLSTPPNFGRSAPMEEPSENVELNESRIRDSFLDLWIAENTL